MKKWVTILVIVMVVSLSIYLGKRLYSNHLINNVASSVNDALVATQTPSFTIDLFEDNTEHSTIKTTVQDDLEKLDPATIEQLMSQYTASAYNDFNDFYQGN